MRACLGIAAVLLSGSVHAQEVGNRLHLVCAGGGAANRGTSTFAQGWDSDGNSAGAIINGQRSVGFEDQLQLWIEGARGKARLPRALLPALRGGKDGWFDVKDVKVSDNEITGTINVSIVNHPKMVLDRLSGTVSLSGKTGQFNGRCRKFDPANTERAF